jgi:L-amino acid N-acyltransferase YncA
MSATKTVTLKDQTEVLIRPMTHDDLEGSLAFFRALPEEDRACLRRDATTPEVAQERLREMDEGQVKRLVALVGGKIVADGALELASYGWEQHVGELRLIVDPRYQGRGLGMLMARALYDLAASTGIEQLVVKMMACQTVARSIFRKLGFHQEAVLHGYVRDCQGRKQDLILMRGELEDLWRQFEEYIYQLDVHGFEME